MSDMSIDAMDHELRRALREGVAPAKVPAGVHERLASRLASSLALLTEPLQSSQAPHSSQSSPDALNADAARSGLTPPTHAVTSLTTKLIGVGIASFLVGAGVGGAIISQRTPAERIVYVDRPSLAVSAPVPTVLVEKPLAVSGEANKEITVSPPSSTAPSTAATDHAKPASAVGATDVTERRLLDEARIAFAHGEPDKTLSLIRRHESQFRSGSLVEEREALAVRALAAQGSLDAARARADRFAARFPRSLMLPAVQSAVQSE